MFPLFCQSPGPWSSGQRTSTYTRAPRWGCSAGSWTVPGPLPTSTGTRRGRLSTTRPRTTLRSPTPVWTPTRSPPSSSSRPRRQTLGTTPVPRLTTYNTVLFSISSKVCQHQGSITFLCKYLMGITTINPYKSHKNSIHWYFYRTEVYFLCAKYQLTNAVRKQRFPLIRFLHCQNVQYETQSS